MGSTSKEGALIPRADGSQPHGQDLRRCLSCHARLVVTFLSNRMSSRWAGRDTVSAWAVLDRGKLTADQFVPSSFVPEKWFEFRKYTQFIPKSFKVSFVSNMKKLLAIISVMSFRSHKSEVSSKAFVHLVINGTSLFIAKRTCRVHQLVLNTSISSQSVGAHRTIPPLVCNFSFLNLWSSNKKELRLGMSCNLV